MFTRLSIRPNRSSVCSTTRCAVCACARSPSTVRKSGSSEGGLELAVATGGWDYANELGLVDNAPGPRPADADEDPLVHPFELGSGGLDLGCSAERVLGRIDVLAGRETGEDFRRTMA